MTEQRDQSNVERDFSATLEYLGSKPRYTKPRYTLTMSAEDWYELLFIVAGISSGAVMQAAPDVVCPTDEISSTLINFLEGALDIPRPSGYGDD